MRTVGLRERLNRVPVDPDDASALIEQYEEALERIAGMTDIEADFDGFEARQIASDALSKAHPEGVG